MNTNEGRASRWRNLSVIFSVLLAVTLPLLVPFLYFRLTYQPLQLIPISHWQIESSTMPTQILWQKSTNFFNLLMWMAIVDTSIGIAGGNSTGLTVIDTQSGETVWDNRLRNVNGLISLPDGYILGGQTRGQTTIRLTENGDINWRNQEDYIRKSRIHFVAVDDRLYLPAQNAVYEYNLLNGELIQTISNGLSFLGAFEEYTLWFDASQIQLVMLNATTNSAVWETEIGVPSVKFLGYVGDVIAIGVNNEELRGYSVSSGQLLWNVVVSYRAATYQDSSVIIYSDTNELLFFDIQTGINQGIVRLSRNQNAPINRDSIALDTLVASESIIAVADGKTEEIVVIAYKVQ